MNRTYKDQPFDVLTLEAARLLRQRAWLDVQSAVNSGDLVRPETCERCGKEGPVVAHHSDYSKPLDVRWLCHKCHKLEHRLARYVAAKSIRRNPIQDS